MFNLIKKGRISLDKVMELKNKKLQKKIRSKKHSNNTTENIEEKKEEMSVFEFINETLISKSNINNRSK